MRDGKGIPNSKFEMRKLEENAHAKPASILLTPRSPRSESPDAVREGCSALCIMSKCYGWNHENRENRSEDAMDGARDGGGVDVGFGGYGVGG